MQPLEASNATPHTGLNLSLLLSDPPDGTEVRQANALFISEVQKAVDLPPLVKRYAAQLTQAFKTMCAKNTMFRKENAQQRETLQTRKKRTTGKRVAMKGKFVFSTQEVLDVVRQAEQATAEKHSRKRRRKGPTVVEIEDEELQLLENVSSDSDSDCIVVQARKLK